MLLPVSLWILLTIAALVISFIGLVIGISSRARMDAIARRTENLEKELDHYRNSLNRERERLEHIESEQLRTNEAADILNKISALRQNMTELEGRKQSLQAEVKVQGVGQSSRRVETACIRETEAGIPHAGTCRTWRTGCSGREEEGLIRSRRLQNSGALSHHSMKNMRD